MTSINLPHLFKLSWVWRGMKLLLMAGSAKYWLILLLNLHCSTWWGLLRVLSISSVLLDVYLLSAALDNDVAIVSNFFYLLPLSFYPNTILSKIVNVRCGIGILQFGLWLNKRKAPRLLTWSITIASWWKSPAVSHQRWIPERAHTVAWHYAMGRAVDIVCLNFLNRYNV